MDFVKRMKKRDFIEMALKSLAILFACFIGIILMEGMIYGITLNGLKNNTSDISATDSSSTIAYCIEQGEDDYLVLFYTEGMKNDQGESAEWISTAGKSKNECDFLLESNAVKELHMHSPSAFKLSITPIHYVVMSVVLAGVIGFISWRFVVLSKQYKKWEKEYQSSESTESK